MMKLAGLASRALAVMGAFALGAALACAHAGVNEIDPRMALAERLMAASGAEAGAERLPDEMAAQARDLLLACQPALSAQAQDFELAYRAELVQAMPLFRQQVRDSYARRLSAEELDALISFYESPEGRSVADATPALMADQRRAQAVIERAMLSAYEALGWCDNGA